MMATSKSNGLVYIGRGSFLPGVPARSLSPEEAEEHGGDEVLVKTGIYRRKPAPKAPDKKEPEPKAPVSSSDNAADKEIT